MKLVCLGDSLTEGYDIDLSKAWCNRLAGSAEISVVNAGISGDTTGGMLARFMHDVVAQKPSHVFIMGGTNDVYLGVRNKDILANIYAMVHQAKFHNIAFIVGIPTRAYVDQSQIDVYREELIHFCKDHDYRYIDMGTTLEHSDFLADGVHPNLSGHDKMYETIRVKLVAFL